MSESRDPRRGRGATESPERNRAETSLRAAFPVWARIAALSFGGPAGQIAVMQRILVEERRWISQRHFLHALNYCMLLPGPEAQQLATYVGWLMHRWRGGLVAGGLFVLPGFLTILALSILYVTLGDVPLVASVFYGIKPAVVAIVLHALVRIARRALDGPLLVAVAALAFLAMFVFDVPFPLVIATAAAVGWLGSRLGIGAARASRLDLEESPPGVSRPPRVSRALGTALLWGIVWWGPVALLAALTGRDSVFVREALFFSKSAVLTFGGAYAVLAYIAQRAVEDFGWLSAGEMLDGLGLAETTPGPLIMVVQFVGFLGAFRDAGGIHPITAGILGSVTTTWVTFAPCFLWIFLGAPYIEHLRGRRSLTAALSGITAAVVGVILNLALWFAIPTLFAETRSVAARGAELHLPVWSSIDPWAAAIAAGVALLLVRRGSIPLSVAAAAAAGIFVRSFAS